MQQTHWTEVESNVVRVQKKQNQDIARTSGHDNNTNCKKLSMISD